MSSTNEQTIIGIILIPVLAATTYLLPSIVSLPVYLGILTMILGFYGIQLAIKLAKAGKLDLVPGVQDKFLIGVDAIFSSGFLYLEGVMPRDTFIGLVLMILSALGLLRMAKA